MPEQKILLGSSQTVISYPRVSDGGSSFGADFVRKQPTSARVRIFTPASTPDADTWQDAVVDDLSVAVSDADGIVEGATSFSVDNPAFWRRGRLYLVDNRTDAVHIVEGARTQFSPTAYLRQPLPEAVPYDSQIRGFACSIALTSAQTATAGECTAIWECTIDESISDDPHAQAFTWAQPFRIVRRMPHSDVTPASLSRDCPEILKKRSRNDIDLEELIQAVWVHEILPLLDAHGIAEEDIVSVEALEPLHVQACLLRVLRNREDTSAEYFARVKERFEQLKDTTFSRSTWFEVNQQLIDPVARTAGADAAVRAVMRMGR